MSSLNLNNCTKKMWCVISPCRLMNIWIYLHKACTKLLQLTVIGWTITLLSKMAGEGFFSFVFPFLFEAIFLCFIVFIFDLHIYCDDMLIHWNRLCFSSLRSGDGLFKMYRPIVPVGARVSGSRHLQNRWARPPGPGLEDFVILWMAANYWEGVIAGEGRVGVTLGF